MCTQEALTRETAMRLNHAQGHNQEDPIKSHAWCNLCVLSIWWEASSQQDSAPFPINRQRAQGSRHLLAQNSSVRRAATWSLEPGGLGTASTPLRPLDSWAYVLGLAICVAPHGLQQTAEHSFYSKCSGREEVCSVEPCGQAKMVTILRCFRMWPIWRSASDRGGRTSRSAGSRGYSASSLACPIRLSHLSCVRTPHMLADGGIDTLQYAVEWKERSLGQTLSTQALLEQTYECVEPNTSVSCRDDTTGLHRAHGLFPTRPSQAQTHQIGTMCK